MRTETRPLFDQYTLRLAQLNGVTDPSKIFTVSPEVQQTLEGKMQESSAFLRSINMVPVNDMQGQKVGIGIGSTIAGRTDTTGQAERQPSDPTILDDNEYRCYQTDFDTALSYARIDAWARHKNFQQLIRNAILERQALDRIMIGFNGTHAAATSNRATNPLLQDVNKGWLQQYRDNAPERVMTGGKTDGIVKVGGADGDYANLDALVMDAVANLIEPWHAKDPGLVVILGRGLLHDKYFPIINQNNAPTEQLAADLVLGTKRMGGLAPADVPFMPNNAILITSLRNLSLYWQIGGRRRFIQEQPAKNRVANFESSNDAYVVEDYGMGCLIENIKVED